MKKLDSNNIIINDTPVLSFVSQIDLSDNHDHGCLILETSNVPEIRKLQQLIPTEELYNPEDSSYGLEEEQHITILYGLDKCLSTQLLISPEFPKIKDYGLIQLNGITLFENEEFDVLKVDVYNPLLNQLFDFLVKNYPNENSHPEYHGHMTVAYLKSGCGKKYVNKDFKKSVIPTNYWYSYDHRNDRFVL